MKKKLMKSYITKFPEYNGHKTMKRKINLNLAPGRWFRK